MATTKPRMARLAVLLVLLAQLTPALASFWTITSYYVLSMSSSKIRDSCTSDCRMYTVTSTKTVVPTVTPTASPVSSTRTTVSHLDYELVRLYLTPGAVAESDLVTTRTINTDTYTAFAVSVTWTAPSTCLTPFTVATQRSVNIPFDVQPYVTAISTITPTTSNMQSVTRVTVLLDQTAVPTSLVGDPSSVLRGCRNPTATVGGTYTGGPSSGGDDISSNDYSWAICAAGGRCAALAAWIIVVAAIIPLIFLLGFVESYCWFRRMMLGKSALRLGTVCWCALSLWFILLTRRSPARSEQDQALLKQYWATLGAGARIKLWFKWGFKWRYPVELLGNPDGSNPVVQPPPPGQPMYAPPGGPDGGPGNVSEKMPANTTEQPMYSPYQGQQPYPEQPFAPQGQPYPGTPPPPGSLPPSQQGYMMQAAPPQAAYPTGQPGDGQQVPSYVPSPSPVHTNTTAVPSVHPTPPPGQGYHQPPPSGPQ